MPRLVHCGVVLYWPASLSKKKASFCWEILSTDLCVLCSIHAAFDGDQSCRATNADASPHVHFCTFSQLGTSSGENAHTTSLLLFGLTQRVNNFSSTKITWRQSCCAYLRANRTRRRLWLTLILGLWDFGILGARQRPPSREVAGVEHTG